MPIGNVIPPPAPDPPGLVQLGLPAPPPPVDVTVENIEFAPLQPLAAPPPPTVIGKPDTDTGIEPAAQG